VKKYDIAVIGSGPAGEKAALESTAKGAKTIVIERGFKPGGASVITGTIPSKSLRETVQYVCSICQPATMTGMEVNWSGKLTVRELMHRKQLVVEERTGGILQRYRDENIDYLTGEGKFTSPHEIIVTEESSKTTTLSADKIIIAVGTHPYHPPGVDFNNDTILDSDTILQLDHIPESLVIIGGGVIGCEYAFIFAKIGTKVTLIDPRGSLLSFVDCEISSTLADILREENATLELGEEFVDIKAREDGTVQTTLKSGKTIVSDALLYANGRQGFADKLNLEACGLEMNSRNQLEVNNNFQTAVPHIYAVGDIIGFPSLVSTSNEEGRRAAIHAVTGENVCRVGMDIPSAIYTIPEVAMIGPTEQELQSQNIPYQTGICFFKDLARGQIIGDCKGMLKLLFNPENYELIAVHIIGTSAAELIHIGQTVLSFKGKITYFIDTVFNFPTLSLAYKVAARDGLSKI